MGNQYPEGISHLMFGVLPQHFLPALPHVTPTLKAPPLHKEPSLHDLPQPPAQVLSGLLIAGS